ncbi:MAG: hypothetical protein B7X38_03585 [Stenotrophomonas sp. 14-69-23]|nr:MAG: hypothetical protein B7X38_03585 [Stenotrophomonas sp. 14-69-23]
MKGNSKTAPLPRTPALGKRSAQARYGRRRQGSKPDGRDSARGRGTACEPGGAGPERLQQANDTEAQMEHNVATTRLEACNDEQ